MLRRSIFAVLLVVLVLLVWLRLGPTGQVQTGTVSAPVQGAVPHNALASPQSAMTPAPMCYFTTGPFTYYEAPCDQSHGGLPLGGNGGATPAPATAACNATDPRSPGQIAFGTALDDATLTLACVSTSFPSHSDWAFRAQFVQPVTPGLITLGVARTFGGGATEQSAWTQQEQVTAPNTAIYGASGNPGFLASLGPGAYVMRLLAGTLVLASGRFAVTP